MLLFSFNCCMVCYYYCHYYYYCCLLQLLSLSWLNLNYFYNLYFGLDWNCFLVYLIVLCLYVRICSWILLQYVFVVPISKISKSHTHTHIYIMLDIYAWYEFVSRMYQSDIRYLIWKILICYDSNIRYFEPW